MDVLIVRCPVALFRTDDDDHRYELLHLYDPADSKMMTAMKKNNFNGTKLHDRAIDCHLVTWSSIVLLSFLVGLFAGMNSSFYAPSLSRSI